MQFSTKLMGYRREQVDRYVEELMRDYEKKIQSLQDDIEKVVMENEKIKMELSGMQTDLKKYQDSEKAVAEVFIQAQLRATFIEEEAHKKAAEIEKAALLEVEEKKKEVEELQAHIVKARKEFEDVLNKYKNIIVDLQNLQPDEEMQHLD
ncbi:DivIVA domain-containing protein [Pelotomaculum propionicicum]|uniref:Cell cycle protein GpsB n=1 Tax=Pelotomaculum propionicicum TaxID=258475 RepID=A0A4Y7RQH1_9FIRM|nr:DivIVA domain-containing protein [Pelotomaculum propionicicum]TEB11066.1 Cell cycle protein GpsB [Pelotomaculum propionicicum]